MKKMSLVAVGLLVLSAGCTTFPRAGDLNTRPVAPSENEIVALDQILVLVDVTGSMWGGKFRYEEDLVEAFAGAMPNGTYEAGIHSFAGVSSREWVQHTLSPYDRARFDDSAERIVLLGHTTPLDRAIRMLTPEITGKGGHGAFLVFSDGKVWSEKSVLESTRNMMAAHNGNLCIYTVQIGDSENGKQVLDAMAALGNCGQSWNGSDLNSVTAIDQMVRTIFFGEKPVPPVAATPPAKMEMVMLNDVLFDFDSAILKPAGKVEVDKLIVMLKANPDKSVAVNGHTCDLGSDAYNMSLSLRRANAVMNYAVQGGVAPDRIAARGYGESQPAVPNTSEANRRLNRRIVIVQ